MFRGEIWANVYGTLRLAVINPQSGIVRCFVDCTGLLDDAERRNLWSSTQPRSLTS